MLTVEITTSRLDDGPRGPRWVALVDGIRHATIEQTGGGIPSAGGAARHFRVVSCWPLVTAPKGAYDTLDEACRAAVSVNEASGVRTPGADGLTDVQRECLHIEAMFVGRAPTEGDLVPLLRARLGAAFSVVRYLAVVRNFVTDPATRSAAEAVDPVTVDRIARRRQAASTRIRRGNTTTAH